ncbi:VOC family protein [Chloroflexota bacterium]
MGYLSPTLAVRDVKKTIDFYTKSFGFKLGMTFPSPENPEYADLHKDDMVLMFIPTSELGIGSKEKLGVGVNMYLQIDGDIDEYYDELKKRDVKIVVDIKDEPFGIRDFTVEDIDGYKLTFSQGIESEHSCDCGDSCGTCLTTCLSCDMPMNSHGDFGGGNPENKYCVHCSHPDGTLKSYDEVLSGMTNFLMTSQKMDEATAEGVARDYMSKMPAWSSH